MLRNSTEFRSVQREMTRNRSATGLWPLTLAILVSLLKSTTAQERPIVSGQGQRNNNCEDKLEAKIIVDPTLESEFFTSTESSYPWYIIARSDGSVEDTSDGVIDKEDLVRFEHTAKCTSTHQGKHAMKFCDANIAEGTIRLLLHGGLPAYASSMTIEIDESKKFRCAFEAVYPALTGPLQWRITRKTLRVKSDEFKEGKRLYGWLSVEFEEGSAVDGKMVWKPHKIEGFLKPVVIK